MKFILIPWAICFVLIILRTLQLELYVYKNKNMKLQKHSFSKKMLALASIAMYSLVPILNLIFIYRFIKFDIEQIILEMIKDNRITFVDEVK